MLRLFELLLMSFPRDERGIAFTEYLVVLALLIGGTIAAVLLFGDALSGAYLSFVGFIRSLDPAST
ncbi:Flp family type IVb pilin [Thalassovita aquimarina]|uniref:Flp/Fap pilin component n=1 Tax=Thalassovita aquimarina TaxID=2785917 RepID=A0ABS5HQ23_9RHOB|nr:hypothetical protein [Thalassovita aquimarina]MBR9651077.1 hypothetical protein [Thalassovita aquimarina]